MPECAWSRFCRTWSTHGNVSNSNLRMKYRLPKLDNVLRQRRLGWFGHAARMEKDRLPRKMLTAQLGTKRPRGRPRQSWRATIQNDLELIDCADDYPVKTGDRIEWRRRIIGPYRRKSAGPPRRSTQLRLLAKR